MNEQNNGHWESESSFDPDQTKVAAGMVLHRMVTLRAQYSRTVEWLLGGTVSHLIV